MTLINTAIIVINISGIDAHQESNHRTNLAEIMEADDGQYSSISFGIVSGIDTDQDVCEICSNVSS